MAVKGLVLTNFIKKNSFDHIVKAFVSPCVLKTAYFQILKLKMEENKIFFEYNDFLILIKVSRFVTQKQKTLGYYINKNCHVINIL